MAASLSSSSAPSFLCRESGRVSADTLRIAMKVQHSDASWQGRWICRSCVGKKSQENIGRRLEDVAASEDFLEDAASPRKLYNGNILFLNAASSRKSSDDLASSRRLPTFYWNICACWLASIPYPSFHLVGWLHSLMYPVRAARHKTNFSFGPPLSQNKVDGDHVDVMNAKYLPLRPLFSTLFLGGSGGDTEVKFCGVRKAFTSTNVLNDLGRRHVMVLAQARCRSMRRTHAALAAMRSSARMDSFTRGAICGMQAAGATRPEIARRVRKKDGKRPTVRAVDAVLAKHRAEPSRHGEDSRAGGRPPVLTVQQRQQLLKLVFAERGKAKVNVPYCRRRLLFLRNVCKDTVRRELLRAGLGYLRRRRKTAVPEEFRAKWKRAAP